MKLVQPTPDWLVQFNRNFDGVAGEMTNLTIDGKAYSISFVCKPTDCAGHKFVVLFDANGARAYGALGGKDNDPAFFGSPTRGRAGGDGEGREGLGCAPLLEEPQPGPSGKQNQSAPLGEAPGRGDAASPRTFLSGSVISTA